MKKRKASLLSKRRRRRKAAFRAGRPREDALPLPSPFARHASRPAAAASDPSQPLHFLILKNYPSIYRCLIVRPLEQRWLLQLWRKGQ